MIIFIFDIIFLALADKIIFISIIEVINLFWLIFIIRRRGISFIGPRSINMFFQDIIFDIFISHLWNGVVAVFISILRIIIELDNLGERVFFHIKDEIKISDLNI